MVTDQSVYHIDLRKDGNTMEKVFDRSGKLAAQNKVQIINYALDPEEKYCYLSGISASAEAIHGDMLLFLIKGGKFQPLEGHFGCFGTAKVHNETYQSTIFACSKKPHDKAESQVQISEIGDPPAGVAKFRKTIDFSYPDGTVKDFPIFMSIDSKHGLLYMVTNQGTLFLFEIGSGSMILRSRLSDCNVNMGCKNLVSGGIMVLNKKGNVICVDTESNYIVEYLQKMCSHVDGIQEHAKNLAIRYGLPGAEQYFTEKFSQLMLSNNYVEAAKVVASSPGELLRNKATLDKFRTLQDETGRSMLQRYFSIAIEPVGSQLNALESMELVGLVITKRPEMVKGWINENKLTLTENLGDLIKPNDLDTAITVYEKIGSVQKVNMCKMEKGDFGSLGNINAVEGLNMIRNAIMTNPAQAVSLAISLTKGGKVSAHQCCEIFHSGNKPLELTKFFVECMTTDSAADSQWQTIVFELNLRTNANYAMQLFQSGKYTHYSKEKLAPLCEQNNMLQQALECYSDLKDIRRIVLNVHVFQVDYLVKFLGSLPVDQCLVCLQDLLKSNRANLNLVSQVASTNFQKLGVAPVVEIFKNTGCYDGIEMFLGQLLPNTQDHEIYFRYIEAALKCGKIQQVEMVITEAPNCYDAQKVKALLMSTKLSRPQALITLCDKNDWIEELTRYLWSNGQQRYIEVYVMTVSPQRAPQVLGAMIDLEAEESYIKQMLNSIKLNMPNSAPVEELIAEFEKRNKVRLLENWLEQRMAEGTQQPAVHNAMIKLAIDTDKDPQKLLSENQFYDTKEIGQYVEDRDPHLAVIAYRRDWGKCDYQLIELTNKNALYRIQAKYLIERKSDELWAHVLSPDNPHRDYIIEQVITALPESKDQDEVAIAVKEFMRALLHEALISLLEKIVLHNK
jgi:clathrin heavy chain